jgi:hypothetical protein
MLQVVIYGEEDFITSEKFVWFEILGPAARSARNAPVQALLLLVISRDSDQGTKAEGTLVRKTQNIV